MTPIETGQQIIADTMAHLLPGKYDSPEARVMLLAIGLQESGFKYREQVGGPARGFWQFEENGVLAVLNNPSSRKQAHIACIHQEIVPVASRVYGVLSSDDKLACAFARLLLWDDPRPLPTTQDEAWNYYERNWRPGKPGPDRWPTNYQTALDAVQS